MPRSTMKPLKNQKVVKDDMSPQTRDEKEYLDFELFTILQQAKKQVHDEESEYDELPQVQEQVIQ